MERNDRFNDLENAVMQAMLDGSDEVLRVLRGQFESAVPKGRETSTGGFTTGFSVSEGAARLSPPGTFTIEDVDAEIEGLENGAGFELFVVGGVIDRLECFSYDERWPAEIGRFKVFYHSGQKRNMSSLRMRWTRDGKDDV